MLTILVMTMRLEPSLIFTNYICLSLVTYIANAKAFFFTQIFINNHSWLSIATILLRNPMIFQPQTEWRNRCATVGAEWFSPWVGRQIMPTFWWSCPVHSPWTCQERDALAVQRATPAVLGEFCQWSRMRVVPIGLWFQWRNQWFSWDHSW